MVYRTTAVFPIDAYEQRELLNYGMSFLSARERNVLEEIYFEGNVMEDIGKSLGVTRQRVEQIRDVACRRLRRFFERRHLYDVA